MINEITRNYYSLIRRAMLAWSIVSPECDEYQYNNGSWKIFAHTNLITLQVKGQ